MYEGNAVYEAQVSNAHVANIQQHGSHWTAFFNESMNMHTFLPCECCMDTILGHDKVI